MFGLIAKVFSILLMTLCPQQEKLVANLAYAPAAKDPGQVCRVRVRVLDPLSNEALGEQDVSLTPQPQQVPIEVVGGSDSYRLVRIVVSQLESCTNPGGLQGMSLEGLDAGTRELRRTMPLQLAR